MRHSECFSARAPLFSENAEVRTNIEDLETSLSINKKLIKDYLQLKKSETNEDDQLIITSKLLKILENENLRIESSISNMLKEISTAKYSLLQAEEKINECRKRKKVEVAKKNNEIELLRKHNIEKEEEIREVQKELQNISEILESFSSEKRPSHYEVLRKQEKMLQMAKEKLAVEEFQERILYKECLKLHKKLKKEKLRTKLALPEIMKDLEKIALKNYSIDYKFQQMFFEDRNDSHKNKSRSSSQSLIDIKFSDTVKHVSKCKPKIPPLKLNSEANENSEMLEQSLLIQLVSSEISALSLLLKQLESYEATLSYKFY